MTAAVLYLRVSTEEQVSNLSLDVQEAECRALCARGGWRVAEVFREEGSSAKSLDRPELQRLLAYLGRTKGRVSRVVVLRVDRLSRNREDFYILRHALRRYGVRLVSVREEIGDDSISAMIIETFSVLQAQVDNVIRANRTRVGMQEATRRGRWVWVAPLGYRHVRGEDGRAHGIEPDPDVAPLIVRAFELVAGGLSVDAAHRELLAAGLRGRNGGPIAKQTFHALLRRPIYAGRLEVPEWSIDVASAAPALITLETFARVRAAIGTRSRPRRATATLADFPLRGVARCGCGRRLAAFHARGKTGRSWPYYRCQRCPVQIPARELERAFLALLGRMAAPEEAVRYVDRMISAAIAKRGEELQARLAESTKRLETAERRLDRLATMRLDDEISAEEYTPTRERLLRERDEARILLAELTTPLDVDAGVASAWARQLLTRPAEVWSGLTGDVRAQFVERVFPAGLVVEDREFSNPERCLLQLPAPPLVEAGSCVVHRAGPSSNIVAWLRDLRELEAIITTRAA